jgi:formylglycine-generating enzyme required for sulfatase activity
VVPETPPAISEDSTQTDRRQSSAIELAESDVPKQSILAEDGASMHFVSAGVVSLSEGPNLQLKRSVKVNPFYMDETLVTNHQLVEFLNHNLSKIRVERGAVRVDDEIWLLLGEVRENYVPIVFQKGEFKVSKIAYASLPALRVTAYGASSYARFYNRRLPTYTEWLLALGNEDDQIKETANDAAAGQQNIDMESMHGKMHTQMTGDVSRPKSPGTKITSVINYQPNKYGIRGLNQNIKEWGLRILEATSRDNIREADFVIMPSTIQRYPWEGFGEVGFRCVRGVKIKAK